MLKRPNPNEDEDEILKQQEEFLRQKIANKIKPAAAVINKIDETATGNTSIAGHSSSTSTSIVSIENNVPNLDIQEQIANTFEAIPTDIKIKNVREKSVNKKSISNLKFDSGGFPKAVRRDPDIKPTKGSIFSQHIKRLKQDKNETQSTSNKMEIDDITLVVKEKHKVGSNNSTHPTDAPSGSKSCERMEVSISNLKSSTLPTSSETSAVLTESDKKKIHEDNIKKLKTMSEEEIILERERLIASMDPALVKFLRSQRSQNKEDFQNRNPTIKEQNEAAETVNLEDLKVPKEMLSMPEATGWLHFNRFEANKLAWMKDVQFPDIMKNKQFEARFDFGGYLLPYCVEKIDEGNRILYHHGDEAGRPGYTLQELLLLSRSNVMQQRIIALNTLANLLALNQTGVYDHVIDVPIEQVFFVLRVSLDDNTPSVLNAAIKGLRNLIYYQLDETCLDNTMSFGIGIVQPVLAVDDEMEDDNTVNDQQLAETNLVKCLARTEIFVRLRYIINTVRPPLETIVYCIEILIRMARDSGYIVGKILTCEGLLLSLMKYFAPQPREICFNRENPGYNMPLPQVIKLLRVISSRSRNIAASLLKKYNLLDTIIEYLNEDVFSQNASGMRLQVECMHYWALLLHYGLALEKINQNESLLLRFVDYHFKNTDNMLSTTLIRQSHVASLFILIAKMVEKGHNLFPSVVSECLNKWVNQFKSFEGFKCGHSQIISSMFYCATMYNKHYASVHTTELLENLTDSKAFDLTTENIQNGSLLLNNYETHKISSNIKSLESAAWFTMDHIVPVLQTNSCIPFLYALSTCVLSDNSEQLKVKFLSHPNLIHYTENLQSAKFFYNTGNWFTRCESFLIMNILKIAQQVNKNINPSIYYDIAVKSLCVFSSEQKRDMKFLLDNIVFCTRFYPIEVVMENAHISNFSWSNELDSAWKHLDDINRVYANILGITSNLVTLESTLSLDMSIGNVIPIDWIYTPLVLLYSKQQERKRKVNEQADYDTIVNCLRWILIYETYFKSLAVSISVTEKYIRLACVFLGSDTLFLNEDVQKLIETIFKHLVQEERKLNFKEEISGLTNFKDFYIQLLEQYQAVSYGNKVFGNVILLPIASRHSVDYRKALWSEYMGVVEVLDVNRDDCWIDFDNFISPLETNLSLCMCYNKALLTNSIPKHSVLFDIANINVRRFQDRVKKREVGVSNENHMEIG